MDYFETERKKQMRLEKMIKLVINNMYKNGISLDVKNEQFVKEFAKEFINVKDILMVKMKK